MEKIYICSPYRGDIKENLEKVKRYCSYTVYEGIPIAPHLYFTQFLDDNYSSDRRKGMRMGLELLKECKEIRVFADEVTEGMIEEIKMAQQLNIPIKFYNSEMEEINHDTLIINKRIGVGYRQIIADTYGVSSGNGICPYAGECSRSCTDTKGVSKESSTAGSNNEGKCKADWRDKLLRNFYRGH
jgi:hypothetical protein